MAINNLNSANYLFRVEIVSQSDGVIIVDVNMGLSTQETIKIPLSLGSMDFSCSDEAVEIVDASNTNLSPTVNSNAQRFEFDPGTKRVKVFNNNSESPVHIASTASTTVVVRVNLSTSTITVFQ